MVISQKQGGVLLSYVSMATNVLVKFLYTPLLLRLLGQTEYGLYSLVISIVGYLAILEFGFGSTVTRYTVKYKTVNDYEGLKKVYGTLSIVYIVIGIIALLVCLCIVAATETIFGQTMSNDEIGKIKLMIFLCGINLLFSFPLQISTAVLTAYERFIFKNAINMIKILLEPLVIILLLYFVHIDSVGAVLTITIFNLLGLVAYYIYAVGKLDFKFYLNRFDKHLLRNIITFSASMFLLSVFEQVQFNSGQFILGMNYGAETIAVWGVAMIFVLNYRSISTAITNVFIPSFLSANFNVDNLQMESLIVKMTRMQCYVLLTILLNFILFGYEFIIMWAGDSYQLAYYASLIVMLPMTIGLLLEFCYLSQMATKNLTYRVLTLYLGFCASFVIVGVLTDITIISYAVIMALSICIGQVFCVILYILKKMHVSMSIIWENIIKVSSAPILLMVISYIVIGAVHKNGFDLVAYIISIVIFNTLLLASFYLFSMNQEEKNIISINK